MILFIPINGYIAGLVKKIQTKQMALKDKRLKAINEMLNGMKVLKLYAWEVMCAVLKVLLQYLIFVIAGSFYQKHSSYSSSRAQVYSHVGIHFHRVQLNFRLFALHGFLPHLYHFPVY